MQKVLVQAFRLVDDVTGQTDDLLVLSDCDELISVPKGIICSSTLLSREFPNILQEIDRVNRFHDCVGFIFKNVGHPHNNKDNEYLENNLQIWKKLWQRKETLLKRVLEK